MARTHAETARRALPILVGLTCAAQQPQPPDAAAPTRAQLHAEQHEQRVAALDALARLGADAAARAPDAARLLGDHAADVRRAAVAALLALRPDLQPAAGNLREIAGEMQRETEVVEGFAFEVEARNPSEIARGLSSPDAATRADAVKQLGSMGIAAEPVLLSLLELVADPSRKVREELGRALPRIAWNGAVLDAVRPLLKDEDSIVRAASAYGLGRDDADAVALLRGAMQDPSAGVRYWATSSLGRCGKAGRQAEPDLTATLRDRNHSVRRAALDAIGRLRLHSERTLAEVRRHMSDPESPHCMQALLCVERIGKLAAPTFERVHVLTREGRSDVRLRALDALWSIGAGELRGAAALRMVEVMCEDDEAAAAHARATLRDWVHPLEDL